MPTTALPGMGAMILMETAERAMARSSDEVRDAAHLDARRRLELVHGDHRTGPHLDDLALYPVILELLFEYPRVELGALLIDLDLFLLDGVEERHRGQLVGADLLQEIEGLLNRASLSFRSFSFLLFLLGSSRLSSTTLTGLDALSGFFRGEARPDNGERGAPGR